MNELIGEVVFTLKNYALVHFEVINLLCSDHNKPSSLNVLAVFRPIFNRPDQGLDNGKKELPGNFHCNKILSCV